MQFLTRKYKHPIFLNPRFYKLNLMDFQKGFTPKN